MRPTVLWAAILLVIVIATAAPVTNPAETTSGADDEWPTFHHDWQRTGYTTAQVPKNLQLLWVFDAVAGRGIRSSQTVVGGKVYFVARDLDLGLVIYAVSADNGSLLWKYPTSAPGYWGGGIDPSPTVVDGRVYVGSWDDHLYCLDAENGGLVWRFQVHTWPSLLGIDGAPAVIDGRVYFGSWNGYFYCLNAENGSLIWSYSDGGGLTGHVVETPAIFADVQRIREYVLMGHVIGAPAVVDGVVYFGTGAGAGFIKKNNFDYTGWVYALTAENGSLLWDFPIGDEICPSPAVVDNRVYIGAGWMGHLPGDGMWALDARTGEMVWYFDTEEASGENWAPVVSSAAVFDGKVYFGSYDDYVYALDAENGALVWKYKADGSVKSSPTVVDSKVFIGGGTKLYVLDADDGSLMWSYDTYYTIYSSPAIAYGKVYIGSSNGKLYCFGQPPQQGAPTSVIFWFIVGGGVLGGLIIIIILASLFVLKKRRTR